MRVTRTRVLAQPRTTAPHEMGPKKEINNGEHAHSSFEGLTEIDNIA